MKVPHRQMILLHQYATSCVKGGTHKLKMFPLFTDRLLRLKDLKYLFPGAHQRGCDTQTEMHIHLTTDSVYQCPPMVITLPLSYLWYFMSIKYMSQLCAESISSAGSCVFHMVPPLFLEALETMSSVGEVCWMMIWNITYIFALARVLCHWALPCENWHFPMSIKMDWDDLLLLLIYRLEFL